MSGFDDLDHLFDETSNSNIDTEKLKGLTDFLTQSNQNRNATPPTSNTTPPQQQQPQQQPQQPAYHPTQQQNYQNTPQTIQNIQQTLHGIPSPQGGMTTGTPMQGMVRPNVNNPSTISPQQQHMQNTPQGMMVKPQPNQMGVGGVGVGGMPPQSSMMAKPQPGQQQQQPIYNVGGSVVPSHPQQQGIHKMTPMTPQQAALMKQQAQLGAQVAKTAPGMQMNTGVGGVAGVQQGGVGVGGVGGQQPLQQQGMNPHVMMHRQQSGGVMPGGQAPTGQITSSTTIGPNHMAGQAGVGQQIYRQMVPQGTGAPVPPGTQQQQGIHRPIGQPTNTQMGQQPQFQPNIPQKQTIQGQPLGPTNTQQMGQQQQMNQQQIGQQPMNNVNTGIQQPMNNNVNTGIQPQQQTQQGVSNMSGGVSGGIQSLQSNMMQQQQPQPMQTSKPPAPLSTVGGGGVISTTTATPQQSGGGGVGVAPTAAAPGTNVIGGGGGGGPPTQQQIQQQIQNHFNALALAYRNDILGKEVLMKHLIMLFGAENAGQYTVKIDDINPAKVPKLPSDFNINAILDKTPQLREMTVQFQKQKQSLKPAQPAQPLTPQQPSQTPQTSQQPPASTPSSAALSATQQSTTSKSTTSQTFRQLPPTVPNGHTVPPPIQKEVKKEPAKKPEKRKKEEEKQTDDDKQSIKELNDVTRIANIDIRNESDHFLPDANGKEDDEHYQAEVEPLFLNSAPLKKKIANIITKKGIKSIDENIYEYVSLAAQDYVKTVIEFLIKASHQRVDINKEDLPFTITNDIKKKLLLIEKRERDERIRKENEENERLLREAKQAEALLKKKIESGQASDAKLQKFSKAKQEEEDKQRTISANSTALAAIGNIKKKATPMIGKRPPLAPAALTQLLNLVKEGQTLTAEQQTQQTQLQAQHDAALKLHQVQQAKLQAEQQAKALAASSLPPPPILGATTTSSSSSTSTTSMDIDKVTPSKTPATPTSSSSSSSTTTTTTTTATPSTPSTPTAPTSGSSTSTSTSTTTPMDIDKATPEKQLAVSTDSSTTTATTAAGSGTNPLPRTSFLPPSSLETTKSRHFNRRLCKKDVFFATNFIGQHVIQKFDLRKLQKRPYTFF
ncbi:hypothetical protein DFA_07255 [Cavenderia fasciculata]|uniref:Transcription initiation factor TFIID component TAF4 C-terminal domain-containing protein n=1 Tax=Cavenderia fasciculata TaxID=261658 RepID=F4PVX1_CACFS|nr:uncharacterized protein DFA_07255 [Cavenderia fasciculata]EGG20135.1 hypothetical protein DFA_07255 [Cavenderia fasciculata]|eukprot:XP_004367118.1 hypothetical protein DFA_07255 [Cavenderia fasciculata]